MSKLTLNIAIFYVILQVILFIPLSINNASAEILSSDRRITWDPGVRGGIPDRTTICATLNPGDDIQAAIDNCSTDQVVKLNPGTYSISSTITLKSGITLRGSGMESTIIKGDADFNPSSALITMRLPYGYDSSMNLAGNPAKGDTTITTSVAHDWSVGDYILIDQLEDPSGDPPITRDGTGGACTWCGRESGTRPIAQWAEITSTPTSTTATIDPPLYWSFQTDKEAQATKAVGLITDAGIEDLTMDNTTSNVYNPFRSDFAVNCWILRVGMKGAPRHMITILGGLWNTIKDCDIDGAYDFTGTNQAYGIYMIYSGSAFLIENNIFSTLFVPIAFEGAMSGHVVAYNYFVNNRYYQDDWPAPGIGFHGAHPIMILIEGNYLDKSGLGADVYWGSSSHQTFFRNRKIQDESKLYGNWGINLEKYCQYYNVVGNVIGTAGLEDYYQMDGSQDYGYENTQCIYRLGYADSSSNSQANCVDPKVKETLLRHGNWDSVNNGVVWDSGISDHDIPASLYLTSRPSWWSSDLDWPSIGADVGLESNNIPAKIRYQNGNDSTDDNTNNDTGNGGLDTEDSSNGDGNGDDGSCFIGTVAHDAALE